MIITITKICNRTFSCKWTRKYCHCQQQEQPKTVMTLTGADLNATVRSLGHILTQACTLTSKQNNTRNMRQHRHRPTELHRNTSALNSDQAELNFICSDYDKIDTIKDWQQNHICWTSTQWLPCHPLHNLAEYSNIFLLVQNKHSRTMNNACTSQQIQSIPKS